VGWTILIVACAVLMGLVDLLDPFKDKKTRWVRRLLAALLIAAGVAALLKEGEDTKEKEQAKDQSARLHQQVSDLRTEVTRSDERLANLQRESIDKISELQSKVDNAELQKQLRQVRKELEAARNPPKARLKFGLERADALGTALSSITLPLNSDRIVTVRLLVTNESAEVTAEDAYLWFMFPEGFEIIKEHEPPPARLRRTRDAPPSSRSFRAADLPPSILLTTFVLDVKVPTGAGKAFPISFNYGCRTCRAKDDQDVTVTLATPTPVSR